MTNRIKGLDGSNVDAGSSRAVERVHRADASANATTAKPGAVSEVQLTDTALRLSALQNTIASLPEVDKNRVEQVRDALNKGDYAINARRIADRLLQLETDLAAADLVNPRSE